jgi:hypothetical protein
LARLWGIARQNGMDPISAIGLASSILAFVDFSSKLVKGIYQVVGAADGATEENADVNTVMEDLEAVTAAIEVDFKSFSKHEKELARLASKCATLSRDLQKTLRSVKVQQGNVPWQTIKSAWKTVTKKDKIDSMGKRIDQYRAELMLRLQMLLMYEVSARPISNIVITDVSIATRAPPSEYTSRRLLRTAKHSRTQPQRDLKRREKGWVKYSTN